LSIDYSDTGLGRTTDYDSALDARLLYSIARVRARQAQAQRTVLGFVGCDLWTAYELSWLNGQGLPQSAIAEFSVPCDSPNIVESKSVKLYLNSYHQHVEPSWSTLQSRLCDDLSSATGGRVEVSLFTLDDYHRQRPTSEPEGHCLDRRQVSINAYTPDANLLGLDVDRDVNRELDTDIESEIEETLYSHLLRSNCPVTNQPDWASVYIVYRGAPIDRDGLLAYLVSYRQHQDFHEQCVEQIFADIVAECQPSALSVYARYLRRGGIDINPFRSTHQALPPAFRHVRQ
jgi:7-cyano-7-deazaguanine reductase